MQHRRNILVVDDWADTADTLAELLQLAGFEARAVYSGQAALAAARARPPDVVISDISMPGMSGLELAGHLRAERNGHPMLLIAVTGHGAESSVNAAIDTAFDHHLVKPADLQQLFKILWEC